MNNTQKQTQPLIPAWRIEVAYIDVLKRIPRTSKDEWVKGYVNR